MSKKGLIDSGMDWLFKEPVPILKRLIEDREEVRRQLEEAARMFAPLEPPVKYHIPPFLAGGGEPYLTEQMRRGRSALEEVLSPAILPEHMLVVQLAPDADAFDVTIVDPNGLKVGSARYGNSTLRAASDSERARVIIKIAQNSSLRSGLRSYMLDSSAGINGDRYLFTRPLCEPFLTTDYPRWVEFMNKENLVFASVKVGGAEVCTAFAGIKNSTVDVFCTKIIEADDTRIIEYYPSWEKAMLGHFKHIAALRSGEKKEEKKEESAQIASRVDDDHLWILDEPQLLEPKLTPERDPPF